jgi:hypothetical protein
MSDDESSEARRILALCGGDALQAFQIVQMQITTLATRTQAILGLSGIVITVTGFSGRSIALISPIARTTIVAGLLIVLAAAAVGVAGVLRLRWTTQEIADSPLATVQRLIVIRDGKERYLSAALMMFVVGFALYCFAVAQLLLAP